MLYRTKQRNEQLNMVFNQKRMKVMISGGGTGGHIFPALSIAQAIRMRHPEAEILFVGAEGRMEMEKVPAAGFRIVGLPVRGFDRSHLWKNIKVLWDLWVSLRKARTLINDFQPDAAVGVGGYASGPLLKAAASKGIPTLIQEQNSYAGVTNKLLAANARSICVAYPHMDRYFPADKIVLTGNPVRQDLLQTYDRMREDAIQRYGLDPSKKTLLVFGGSLGARSLNEGMLAGLESLRVNKGVQVIWQTGSYYYKSLMEQLKDRLPENVHMHEFLYDMQMAYAAADLIVSRAGAGSISELSLLSKAVILVPSPNVAEDHQTKNARTLVQEEAAVLLTDAEARVRLVETAIPLIQQPEVLETLKKKIHTLAMPDAANRIVDELEKIVGI